MTQRTLRLVAGEHPIGELQRLRAPERGVQQPLELAGGGELSDDALEHAVADERAGDLLGQGAGERAVDDAGKLGRGEHLVDGLLDRPSPGPRRRASGEERGAPGRVGQPGALLLVLRRHYEESPPLTGSIVQLAPSSRTRTSTLGATSDTFTAKSAAPVAPTYGFRR